MVHFLVQYSPESKHRVQLKREYKFNLAVSSSTHLDKNLDILLSCSSSFEIIALKLNIFAIRAF